MLAVDLAYKSVLHITSTSDSLEGLLEPFSRGIYRVVVLDEEMKVKGIISAIDVLEVLLENLEVEVSRVLLETSVGRVYKKAITLPSTTSLKEALEKAVETGLVHFILVDDKDRIRGLMTEGVIVKRIGIREFNLPIKKIMTTPTIKSSPYNAVYDAAKLFTTHNIKRVLLEDVTGLYGYISAIDVLRWLKHCREEWRENFKELSTRQISNVIDKRTVFTLNPESDVSEVLSLMRGGKEDFVVVVEEGEVVGVVTERDVIVRLIREIGVEEFLKHLEQHR